MRALLGSFALALMVPLFASAALPPSGAPGADLSCVKAKFNGTASTYNPQYEPNESWSLATGGRYNPNDWAAALQINLARQYGCGIGAGKTCKAVVSVPSTGRAAVVTINDNGPLAPGRVIDLNEKSMQYLSAGRYGRANGLLPDVSVTLLCDLAGTFVGPLNEADRLAWQRSIENLPYAQVPATQPAGYPTPIGYSAGLTTSGVPTIAGGVPGRVYSQDSYCIASIYPVEIHPVPAGTPFPSYCYNGTQQSASVPPPPPPPPPPMQTQPFSQGQLNPHTSQQMPGQNVQTQPGAQQQQPLSLSQQLLQAIQGDGQETAGAPAGQSGARPAYGGASAQIIAQPPLVAHGDTIVVSWSSVGMSGSEKCTARFGTVVLAQENEGTAIVSTRTASRGTQTFTLQCMARTGEKIERTARAVVN